MTASTVFAGNDVVDLAATRAGEPLTRDWIDRHLTRRERAAFPRRQEPALPFWSLFAAKEAASKAFAQGGLETPQGGFTMLEADLLEGRVTHLPSGERARLVHLSADAEHVHAVALFSPSGSRAAAGYEIVAGVRRLPAGGNASDFARECLIADIAPRLRGAPSPDSLAIGTRDGIPRVLQNGEWRDWSVSLSHSGRFVAWSWVASRSSG